MHLSEEETVAATINSSGKMSSSCPTRTVNAILARPRHSVIWTKAANGADEIGMHKPRIRKVVAKRTSVAKSSGQKSS